MLSKSPFIEPCIPTLRKEQPTGLAWVHEVKFDGYRLQLHKEGKDICLFSKSGNDFTSRFSEIAIAAASRFACRFLIFSTRWGKTFGRYRLVPDA